MAKCYDVWSDRVFEANLMEIIRIIEEIGEYVYDEISHGKTVNKVDIMNDFYRRIGLPEVNFPKEQFYFNNEFLHWTMTASDYEGTPVVELDSYFN